MKMTPGPWSAEFSGSTGGENPVDLFEITNGHTRIAENVSAEDAPAIAALPDLIEALTRCERLINEALPKFNWGASALDANAIALLNETPAIVRGALSKAGVLR